MADPTYSFVYDRQSADVAFHGIAARELALSVLAGRKCFWCPGCQPSCGPGSTAGGTP